MTAPSADVIVVGFNTMDLVFTSVLTLEPDTKVHAHSLAQIAGGQGANVAVDLAGLGLGVRYLGMFGDDAWGDRSRASLTDVGIDTTGSVVVPDCPNHVAVVAVGTAEAQRSIVMCKDDRLTPPPALVTEDDLRQVKAFYTDGHEVELSIVAARLAQGVGVRVFSDLEVLSDAHRRLVAHVDELVAPLSIITELGGTDDEAALSAVRALGPSVVVATKASEGCAGLDEDGEFFALPAAPAEVNDTTGAGDAFHAGFISARLRGEDVRTAAGLGNRAGALKCAFPGPRVPVEAMRGIAVSSVSAEAAQ